LLEARIAAAIARRLIALDERELIGAVGDDERSGLTGRAQNL
jgi:hypothetical protein